MELSFLKRKANPDSTRSQKKTESMGSSEFELIDWIRRRPSPTMGSGTKLEVQTGIGDDCAVVDTGNGTSLLLASDLLTEGVHFQLHDTGPSTESQGSPQVHPATPAQVGWKALAVNLSDIASMGGTAHSALISLALPGSDRDRVLRELYLGIDELASRFGVGIIGGDLCRSPGPLTISVTVLGTVSPPAIALRSQARVGQALFVTGTLGGSLAGRHLDFVPRLEAGRRLVERHGVRAMIDLSDGLAQDLSHLARESGAGAWIREGSIPVSNAAEAMATEAGPKGPNALERALEDGEDFELLFTIDRDSVPGLLKDRELGVPVHEIGEIIAEPVLVREDVRGVKTPLGKRGYDHFRN